MRQAVRRPRLVAWLGLALAVLLSAPAKAEIDVTLGYLRQDERRLPPLSLLDQRHEDEGLAGARLGVADNATTGKFLKHNYALIETIVPEDGDLDAAARGLLDDGARFILADLHAAQLEAIRPLVEEAGGLIFNARAPDNALRTDACHAAVFHIALSRAQKADALAQYLMWKKWDRWFLLHGTTEADLAMKAAFEAAAARYNATIVDTRAYEYEETARRVESGHTLVQRQMPVFTQNAPEHHVVVVADEADVFGEFLPYRTWDPRPVAGTQGLMPLNWHRSTEQWGGTQLQSRFEESAGRIMLERDYNAWLAARIVGEAVTRTNSGEPQAIHDYLVGGDFEVAAFKGRPVTFRHWNQQLRQPVLLSSARMLVSVSPQEGFLHQRSELDTLGFDAPETTCTLNEEPTP